MAISKVNVHHQGLRDRIDEINDELAFTATPAAVNVAAAACSATAGVATASKAVILDANKAVDVVRTASLRIGASGAEVALTATPAELNALASAASGLGSSNSYAKTDAGTKTLVAAHATKDRGVLVVVTCTETFATGDGAKPTVKIGETDTTDKAAGTAVFAGMSAGDKIVLGFTNTATKAILATLVAATGTGAGAVSILVMALPNS